MRTQGSTKVLKPKESQVQLAIVEAFRLAGAEVLETSAHRQKGTSGVDFGIPDLLIGFKGVPVIVGLEVKPSQEAKRRPDQVRLNNLGLYEFVWTVEMALQAVLKALRHLHSANQAVAVSVGQAIERLERVKRSIV